MKTQPRSLLSCLLIASMFMGLLFPVAHAFITNMNASLVIGEPDFNTNSGGVTTQNGLYYPSGAAVDSLGDVWVADAANNRVLEFTPPFFNGKDAILVLGQLDFTTRTADNYPQTHNGFNEPAAVAFDSAGNLWVSDRNGDRVLEFKPPFTNNMLATLVIGQTDFMSQCPCTTRYQLSGPEGLTFDKSGNLWVADEQNNRVLEYKPPFSIGMNANLVIGQSVFTTSGAFTNSSRLSNPEGVAFDSAGNLWVSDFNNNRVLMFKTPFASDMVATLVIGQSTFLGGSSNGGSLISQTGFNSPAGLRFDGSGNLWVADQNNYRVLMFAPPFSTGMNANLVLGQPDFNSASPNTAQNGLSVPQDVAFDSLGDLWVVDDGNNRVLEFPNPAGLTASALELHAGWDLVSLPLVPANSLITQLLAGLIQYNDLVIVWGYSTTPTPTWSSFTPPNSGALKNMVDGLGYWVNVKAEVNMTVAGYVIPPASSPPAYKLTTGWNLVGFKPQPDPTSTSETVSGYLASITGSYDTSNVWVYNTGGNWVRMQPTDALTPGQAMWILMTAPATLKP